MTILTTAPPSTTSSLINRITTPRLYTSMPEPRSLNHSKVHYRASTFPRCPRHRNKRHQTRKRKTMAREMPIHISSYLFLSFSAAAMVVIPGSTHCSGARQQQCSAVQDAVRFSPRAALCWASERKREGPRGPGKRKRERERGTEERRSTHEEAAGEVSRAARVIYRRAFLLSLLRRELRLSRRGLSLSRPRLPTSRFSTLSLVSDSLSFCIFHPYQVMQFFVVEVIQL